MSEEAKKIENLLKKKFNVSDLKDINYSDLTDILTEYKLPLDFILKYLDVFGAFAVVVTQEIPEDVMEKYPNLLKNAVYSNKKLSEEFILKHLSDINLREVAGRQELSYRVLTEIYKRERHYILPKLAVNEYTWKNSDMFLFLLKKYRYDWKKLTSYQRNFCKNMIIDGIEKLNPDFDILFPENRFLFSFLTEVFAEVYPVTEMRTPDIFIPDIFYKKTENFLSKGKNWKKHIENLKDKGMDKKIILNDIVEKIEQLKKSGFKNIVLNIDFSLKDNLITK